MTPGLLDAYSLMLPRLQAEHDLRMMNVIAAGTGSMKAADHRQYVRDLVSAMDSRRTQRARPATDADLVSMGVEVEEVPGG